MDRRQIDGILIEKESTLRYNNLFLQDISRILNSFTAPHINSGTSFADIIQSNALVLDGTSFF